MTIRSVPFGHLNFPDSVALGLIPNVIVVHKFGRNPVIDTTSDPEDVWGGGGEYTGQPLAAATPETLTVVSDSTADTPTGSAAGAWTIRVEGLDENWAAQSEDFTMNGQTPVTGSLTWRRVFRAYCVTAGSSGNNVGTISGYYTTTTATVFLNIQPSRGQTTICAYTIPAGYKGLVYGWTASGARSNAGAFNADFSLLTRDTGGNANAAWRSRDIREVTSAASHDINREGLVLDAKTDIKVRVREVSASGVFATATMDIVLVEDV